jgi:AbrB family looped-hinge helix DNA binding protein
MRVTEKGQVTIPKPIRDRLGIGPGSEVEFVERGEIVVLQKQDSPAEPTSFEDWVASVRGTIDTRGLDGKAYVDWLRGPRDDLDTD